MSEMHELRDRRLRRVRNVGSAALRRGQVVLKRRKRAHVDEQDELVEVFHGVVNGADRAAGFFGQVTSP